MSRRVLLVAVRDALRAAPPNGLGYQPKECDLTLPGGMPHARAGKWFLGVWPGGWANTARTCLDGRFEVSVTLTMRVNEPVDRVGEYLAREGTFYDKAEAVATFLHKDNWDQHLMQRANALLGDPGAGNEPMGFREALTFLNDTGPRLVGPDWFSAEADATNPPLGIAVDLRFGKARRIWNLANVNVAGGVL